MTPAENQAPAPDEPELSPEQLADLARVEQLEKRIAPPELDANGQPVVVEAADPAEENTAILAAIVGLLTPAAPFLQECYTPPVIKRIATAYTVVEQKYGWNARALLSVEAQLAIVALPPTIQAFFLGREYFRARALENKLPWWLKWLRRKKPEPKIIGADQAEEGA